MDRIISAKLSDWQKNEHRKPLILKGLRQSGKTFVLQRFGKEAFPNVHYLNFEESPKLHEIFARELDPQLILSALSFELQATINPTDDLVIFDEIQDCPRALTSLKYFCEKMPELALACAGSLLGLELNNASYPVGKVDFLHLYPMTFQEFLLATDELRALSYLEELQQRKSIPVNVHQYLWERLKRYFVIGGMPEAILTFKKYQDTLFQAFTEVRIKQQALISAYYADIAKHSGKVNAMHINRVWRASATQLAVIQSDGAKRFKFTGVVPGIDRYQRLVGAIDWLDSAGLILKTSILSNAELPLAAFCKESLFKMYVCDVGLLGAMTELNPQVILQYDYGTYKGYFAENFVAQELLAQAQQGLYCWQHQRAEIEFIRMVGDAVIPIEVKAGAITRAKSLDNFVHRYSSPQHVIMSAQPMEIISEINQKRLPLYLAGSIDTILLG